MPRVRLVKPLVSDDLSAYKPVVEELGLEHQSTRGIM